jgi:acid phosphatase (class A)
MARHLILACAATLCLVLSAQDPAPAKSGHFLAPTAIDVKQVLAPPPALGSLASLADVEAVRMSQAWRSPEQVVWAQNVDKDEPFAFADVLGPWFTAESLPRCAKLLREAGDDANTICWKAKAMFSRPRPYQVDERIQPCVPRQSNSSYPSGHSLNVFTRALVLGEVFPGQRAALLDRAHRAAWGRILGGVHFPTDDVAGRLLAEAIFQRMKESPEFQAEVLACRKESEGFTSSK